MYLYTNKLKTKGHENTAKNTELDKGAADALL